MTEEFIKNILAEELFGYKICESIEDNQILTYFYHRIFENDNILLEKLLYGEPISVPELRKLLRKKIVNFEFIKLNGEVRPAKGTTMMKYIPPQDHPKGIRPSSPKVATFFDLDKDAWRSVSKRSKEIVLKKDKKTGKPIVVVKDTPKIKVKPIAKKRESKDPIEQGQNYKYTTNRGTNTYVDIIRELPNGDYQVHSPLFKTTFAINPNRIGNKFTPKEQEVKVKDVELKGIEPEVPEIPIEKEPKEPIEKAPKEPKKEKQNIIKPVEVPPEKETTVIIPQETEPEEDETVVKSPPADITPPLNPEEEEGPEELEK